MHKKKKGRPSKKNKKKQKREICISWTLIQKPNDKY